MMFMTGGKGSGLGSQGVAEAFGSSVSNLVQQGGVRKEGMELGWNRGFVGSEFARGGVAESQAPSVEHEPPGVENLAARVGIDRVSDQRTSEVLHVNANLVRSARVEVAENKAPGRLLILPQDVVVGDGGFSRSFSRIENGLFLPVHRVAADMGENRAKRLDGCALGKGKVELARFPGGKLGEKGLQGAVTFGCDNATAGFPVEAMDDSRPLYSTD